MGCLVGIFVYPFKFLKWAFTNGWKGIIVLVVVIIVLLVGFFVIRCDIDKSMNAKPGVTASTPAPPSIEKAPYKVDTWSRTYYAIKATKDSKGVITMSGYYELIKSKWTLNKSTLILDESFGKVTMEKRKE
jgi:hypothetical protein